LTTYNATAGGKNGLAARALFIVEPLKARGEKAPCPLADMAFAEFHRASRGSKRLAVGQQ
jgi:hypothetical protein